MAEVLKFYYFYFRGCLLLVNWHLDTLGSKVKPLWISVYCTEIEHVFRQSFRTTIRTQNYPNYPVFTYQQLRS